MHNDGVDCARRRIDGSDRDRFRLRAAQTAGSLTMFEFPSSRGARWRQGTHADAFVEDGLLAGVTTWVLTGNSTCGPGDPLHPQVVHHFANSGTQDARGPSVIAPGRFRRGLSTSRSEVSVMLGTAKMSERHGRHATGNGLRPAPHRRSDTLHGIRAGRAGSSDSTKGVRSGSGAARTPGRHGRLRSGGAQHA
jgi:hypothetical protein